MIFVVCVCVCVCAVAEIKSAMSKALRKVGFSGDRVTVLPVSALAGDNLVGEGGDLPTLPWWGGASLLQHLQVVPVPVRNVTKVRVGIIRVFVTILLLLALTCGWFVYVAPAVCGARSVCTKRHGRACGTRRSSCWPSCDGCAANDHHSC